MAHSEVVFWRCVAMVDCTSWRRSGLLLLLLVVVVVVFVALVGSVVVVVVVAAVDDDSFGIGIIFPSLSSS